MKKTIHAPRVWLLVLSVGSVVASCRIGEMEPKDVTSMGASVEDGVLVSDTEAGEATTTYQRVYKENNHAVQFSLASISELVKAAGPECKGIRIYRSVNNNPAIGKEGAIGLIIVGTDSAGNDLITQTTSTDISLNRALASYDKCHNNCDDQSSVLDTHPNPER